MPKDVERPQAIPLEPQRVRLENGSAGVALRDPMGVLPESVVSLEIYRALAHCDGRRTLPEIADALAASGYAIPMARLAALVGELRSECLLRGPPYSARRAQALAAYRRAPRRTPACAGGVYPDEPDALRRMLNGFFLHPDGPGPRKAPADRSNALRLLVAPHIDFRRGGPCYAHAYRALQLAQGADLYVVFGTAHASPARPFTLTRLDYDTPLGPLETDRRVADALVAELGEDELLGDELVHKEEHSCEFQMIWLRHLDPALPIRVLPVLCSSISHLEDPRPAIAPFLAALAKAVAGRRVCYVASADLAHVGPRYGDARAPSASELARLAAEDRRTLTRLGTGDPTGFHREATRDDGRRRLCGVAPIYAAMSASGSGARLLHYQQWTDGADSVSFAAAAG